MERKKIKPRRKKLKSRKPKAPKNPELKNKKTIKKPKRKKLKKRGLSHKAFLRQEDKFDINNIKGNEVTGYGARTDPVCNVCGENKPLNWHVKYCADITCKGKYVSPKRKLKRRLSKK